MTTELYNQARTDQLFWGIFQTNKNIDSNQKGREKILRLNFPTLFIASTLEGVESEKGSERERGTVVNGFLHEKFKLL